MLTILQGDALESFRELSDESVQCCVTSPPYWGLRDYGTAAWEGGDEACDHRGGRLNSDHCGDVGSRNEGGDAFRNSSRYVNQGSSFTNECGKCGAKRIDSQIGLEETPEAYVAKMVEVFREVRRVLRNDGTLWMNLGDTYSSGGRQTQTRDTFRDAASGKQDDLNGTAVRAATPEGCKPKDLVGIPWMVAFALRSDGWYLRSDIIWHKPNPMPESVTDRPTKAHEYLFLLSKRERYFYDVEAIRESVTGNAHAQGNGCGIKMDIPGSGNRANSSAKFAMHNATAADLPSIRNKRSVWTVATAPYSEAHFATYPPDLIKPCILAGSKAGDTILDPFAGSGTTGMVAIELGRKAVLIELNPEYISLIEQRCSTTLGMAL